MKSLFSFFKILLLLSIVTTVSYGYSQPAWERAKGDCEQVFQNYQRAKLSKLVFCMKIWQATRGISLLTDQQKRFMASVFARIYIQGDEESSYFAKVNMARLGYPPTKEQIKNRQKYWAKRLAPHKKKHKRYIPLPASKAAKRKAFRLRAKGYRLYRRGKYEEALRYFEKALKLYGGYIQALYDDACTRARLGDKDGAIEYLKRLRDLKSKEAFKKLIKARHDKDFAAIRETPEFKEVTGYAHVKILNGMPPEDKDIGDDNLLVLKEVLAKLGYPPEEIGIDKHVRTRPIIWYKKTSKPVAYFLRNIFSNPHVLLVPIDWNTKWDIIISWADKVVVTSDGSRTVRYSLAGSGGSGGGIDPDQKANQLLDEENKMLYQPQQYARKAEHTITTPKRMMNKAKSAVDAVKSTGKTINNVIEKAKNPLGR